MLTLKVCVDSHHDVHHLFSTYCVPAIVLAMYALYVFCTN